MTALAGGWTTPDKLLHVAARIPCESCPIAEWMVTWVVAGTFVLFVATVLWAIRARRK